MSALPDRKPMRAKYADYSHSGAYFLTICTQDRKKLLSTVQIPPTPVGDGALDVPPAPQNTPCVCLTPMGRIVEKYILSTNRMPGVTVDRYVIMPDHVHIIIFVRSDPGEKPKNDDGSGTSRAPSPTNATVPRVISSLKRLCHAELGEVIFQRSYMDHIIRNQQDYESKANYIEENPLRWYAKHEEHICFN